jgi:hypothetical protein
MGSDVFANMMSVSCKAASGKSICAFPDVCFTPPLTPATPPGVPIPYPNTGMATDASDGSSTVKIGGQEVMLKNKSSFKKSSGDEAGSAPKKGVLTAKNMGKVYFNAWSMDVKVEGENVVRMLDLTTHNHGSMPGNSPPFPYIDAVAPSAAVAEKEQKGTFKVKVVDERNGDAVEGATVTVGKLVKRTDAGGTAEFPDLSVGNHTVVAEKHFTDADHVNLLVHYPRVMLKRKAYSEGTTSGLVPGGGTVEAEIGLTVYRLVPDMVFHRRHIELNGEDKYGHWWTCVDGGRSYGWWPKYPVGHHLNQTHEEPQPPADLAPDAGRLAKIGHMFSSAAYAVKQKMFDARESSIGQTLMDVEGELNGQTSFGGTADGDPHALGGDAGTDQYQAVVSDARSDADIRNAMVTYAKGYSGTWSWRLEFGNHCHTFQKKLMSEGDISRFKLLT